MGAAGDDPGSTREREGDGSRQRKGESEGKRKDGKGRERTIGEGREDGDSAADSTRGCCSSCSAVDAQYGYQAFSTTGPLISCDLFFLLFAPRSKSSLTHCNAQSSLTYTGSDWQWQQRQCSLQFSHHSTRGGATWSPQRIDFGIAIGTCTDTHAYRCNTIATNWTGHDGGQ